MSTVLVPYVVGILATFAVASVVELRWPPDRRRPLSAQLGLALLWPLYLLFLAAVAVSAWRP